MSTNRIACSFLVGAALELLLATAASAVPRRIFVTSVSGNGRLGDWPDAGTATGLAAGDAICRARAAAGGLPNAATYRAWLSSDTTDAFCHVYGADGELKSDNCGVDLLIPYGPWYQTNGSVAVTPRLTTLTTTSAERKNYAPIANDEYGDSVPTGSSHVWTGTSSHGTAASANCYNWTYSLNNADGEFGGALWTGDAWTDRTDEPCDSLNRLICVEPGISDSFEPKWNPGRLTFVTSIAGSGDLSTWPGAGGASGLAAGDAVCRDLAAAAHLPAPSTFFAWLSTDTVDAGSRLAGSGTYRRVDGFTVAGNIADLLTGLTGNSIHVTEAGEYSLPFSSVRTGTDGTGQASTRTCDDWTSSSAAAEASHGALNESRSEHWTANGGWGGCSSDLRFYCFSNTYVLFWDGFDLTGDNGRWSSAVP